MSILITGDLHFSDNPRDSYRWELLDHILQIVRKHGVTTLIVLGDLTESKDQHRAGLVNKVVDFFCMCAEEVGDVIILRGNHDGLKPTDSFFRFLSHFDGIRWFDTRTVNEIGGKDVLFLPHTTDWSRDWKKLDFSKYDLIFAHNTFAGSDVGHGYIIDKGPPVSLFGEGSVVISGDVHVPQTVGPVVYVGAPYHIDFGDDYSPRMILADNSMEEFTSIPISIPSKEVVEITDPSELDKATESFPEGSILKVVVLPENEGDTTKVSIIEQVRNWASGKEFQIDSVKVLNSDKQASRRVIKKKSVDDIETLNEYMKSRRIRGKVAKTGVRLMEKSGG